MTKLKHDWHNLLHMYLGYRLCDDDDDLRALNRGIKRIITIERAKWKK
jgi:hypothetical protein